MTRIVKILSLLPILYTEYEEVKLITQLNNVFKFDHNIYLLDASADIKRFIHGQNTPKSLFVFEVYDDVTLAGLEELAEIKSKNTLTIVVPGSPKYEENLQFLGILEEIQRLQINMKIGMFFMHSPSNDDLKKIFKWCKEHIIVNIFATTYIQGPSDKRSLNIFTFNPFGPFNVINVTGRSDETFERFFPSLKSNFQRHKLLVLKGEHMRFSDRRVWSEILRRMNATFQWVKGDSLSTIEPLKQGIDILPQLYLLNDKSCTMGLSCDPTRMYPMSVDPQVIIVPEALPYTEFAAYLQTITSDKFFGYSLFTIVGLMLLLSVVRYIEQKKILFFQSVADVLNLIANDNGYIRYQRLSRVEVFLIVPLTFMGFIFVNGILSNLQSYLTRPVLQPQINTAEDLYRYPINIATYMESKRNTLIEVLTDSTGHKDWSDRIVIMEPNELMKQVRLFNRSISTHIDLKDAILLFKLQKRLNINGFRKIEIRLQCLLPAHIVHHKFLYFERLNEIVHRMQSAGLYNVWRREDQAGTFDIILSENIENLKNHEESYVEDVELPIPMFIVYGWVAGVIVFIIEISWKNISFTLAKKFNRILTIKFGRRR